MARAFLYDIQVDTGLVQAFSLDTLVADDLPRVTPNPEGGYTFASVAVDQYGRVVTASSGDTSNFARLDAANVFYAEEQTIRTFRSRTNLTLIHEIPSPLGTDPFLACYDPSSNVVFFVHNDGSVHCTGGFVGDGSGLTGLVVGGGGTGSDLSATGPGLVYQATAGAALTVVQSITGAYTITSDDSTHVPLTIKGAASQSANLLDLKTSAGAILASVGSAGNLTLNPSSGALISTSNSNPTVFKAGTQDILKVGGSNNEYVIPSGITQVYLEDATILWNFGNDVRIKARDIDFSTSNAITLRLSAGANMAFTVSANASGYTMSSTTSTSAWQYQGGTHPSWIDSTNATRKARVIHTAYDTSQREYLRADTDGSNAVCAFGGAVTTDTRLTVNGTALGSSVINLTTAATNDDPNFKVQQNRVATTDATVTTLDTIAITASNTYLIEARVAARRTGGAAGTADDGAVYIRRAMVTTKAGTVTINAVQDDLTQEDQAAWDCTLDVSGTSIRIRVTGAANNNVTWHSTTFVSNLGT